ncbi:MAG: hypothetical protein ACREO0_05495 [Pseudoxanthomonas sp.]
MSRASWFVDQRIAWIAESVRIFGAIKRQHIKAKFGVSTPQASLDIAETNRRHPTLLIYDASLKTYRRNPADPGAQG